MALINHPALYSGGAVDFNSQPHVQLWGQLQAKKRAQEEAFDEYLRNLNKNVNSAGLRNVDREIFDKKLADWQKFGIENRDDIRKRKGGADMQFMQKYQELLNDIAESKGEEEKKKPLTQLLLDPSKRELMNEDAIAEIEAHDLPLQIQAPDGSFQRNPNRKSIDYSSISFNPKPFEQDKYFKQFEDIKRMELPPVVVNDPKTMTQTKTTTSVFDDEAKDIIATRAVTDYMQNRSFKKIVDGLKVEDYNPTFRANYGRDIQSPADLAAAYTLKGLQQKTVKSEVSADTFERQKQMAAINDQYARGRIALQQANRKAYLDYKNAGNKQEQESVLEGYINRTYDTGKGTYNPVMVKGKFEPGRQVTIPVEVKNKYTLKYKDKNGNDVIESPRFVMTNDKKYVVPLYPGRKSDYQPPIPMELFRNDLGKLWLTKKDAAGEMGELDLSDDGEEEVDITTQIVQPQAAPANDSYTREELKSGGWTDDQINKAQKAGKIKLK